MTETLETPIEPQPILDPETGDEVWVVFWRANVLLDGRDAGAWDAAAGRVVAAGRRRICYEAGNPNLAPWHGGDGEAPAGSCLRFADPSDCYASQADAASAARTRTPPAR